MSCPLGEQLNCACSGRIPGGGVERCSKLGDVPTWDVPGKVLHSGETLERLRKKAEERGLLIKK